MDDKLLKYLSDIARCISQVEKAVERFGKSYDVFEPDTYD